jgi:uncharacterized membrane protein YccC
VQRLTTLGWFLLTALAVTAALAVVAPGAALVGAAVVALVLLAVTVEGSGAHAGWFDVKAASERKREALTSRFKRGRPEWEVTAPDYADEPQDAIFERERKRRGLG